MAPGVTRRMSPLVRRIVAGNPSVYTYHGTGTFIIGNGDVAVIDAGPALPGHVEAILEATRHETITHQFITHTHSDHSPAARLLKEATGAEIWAYGPAPGYDDATTPVDESEDRAFAPDHLLRHGDRISGTAWTVEAVHTPGHASNHLCYALDEEKTLFSGDHVMGWSTSVVSPPDGDMASYLASLDHVLQRGDAILRPTHGAAITDPATFVRALLGHRAMRDRQIMACLKEGVETVPAMVETIYVTTDRRLHPAARRSVLAHLIRLVDLGHVAADDTPDEGTRYHLA